MLSTSPRKMWFLIGAAGAVAIVALGWVLLISGAKSDKSATESQIADTQSQIAQDRGEIAKQRKESEKLPAYRAQLAGLKAALPNNSATSAFAKDLQELERECDVDVTSSSFTPPSAPAAAAPADASSAPSGGSDPAGTTGSTTPTPATSLATLGINVTVQGTHANLQRFLKKLQTSESRAVVVDQVTEAVPVSTGKGDQGLPSLAITMKAFVGAS